MLQVVIKCRVGGKRKEDHATRFQETIAAYFMAQRIKPDKRKLTSKQLVAAHQVMVAAMKCKAIGGTLRRQNVGEIDLQLVSCLRRQRGQRSSNSH